MLKKAVFVLVLVLVVIPFVTSVVLAARGSDCPQGFTLEMHVDHEDHHHQHVGTSADRNNDGYICMKAVTPDQSIHVHIDNNVP